MNTISLILGVVAAIFALLWILVFLIYGLAIFRNKISADGIANKEAHEASVSNQAFISNIDGHVLNKDNDKDKFNIQPQHSIDEKSKTEEIAKLLEQVKENNILLLAFGSVIGLNAEEIIDKEADLVGKFKIYCSSVLNKDNFSQITKARIELGEYTDSILEGVDIYYEIYIEEFFDKFKFFILNFDKYFELIESKNGVIAAKKRVLVSEDEFGELNGSAWVDYLQRFAEKRELVNPHAIVASEFEAVTEILRVINLDNFQGKLLGYIFSINEYIQKKEDPLGSVITGVDFELHLKSMIETDLPGVYVETTPASGDHGADLIVRYKGITIAIQAKYYTGSVGNGAVQEIHSGMGFYDADYGVVVTQSTYTDHAKSLANKLGIHLESVDSIINKIKSLAK